MPRIEYLSHACFMISEGERSVLIDPFITGNPNAPCAADELAPDAILVSHGHADHLGDAIPISKRTGAVIVAVYELAMYCEEQGAIVHPMGIGGRREFDWGSVKLVPAFHSSSVETERGMLYTGMPAGIVVSMGGKTVYFAGDTCLFGDMALIGRQEGLDVAILPIGDNFTMGIDDAVEATILLQPGAVIPMHYGTFDVIQVDRDEFSKKLEDLAVKCIMLDNGDSWTIE